MSLTINIYCEANAILRVENSYIKQLYLVPCRLTFYADKNVTKV